MLQETLPAHKEDLCVLVLVEIQSIELVSFLPAEIATEREEQIIKIYKKRSKKEKNNDSKIKGTNFERKYSGRGETLFC